VAGGLNPALGLGYSFLSGEDPFTGQKTAQSFEQHMLLAAGQFLSMPLPSRLLDLPAKVTGSQPSGVSRAFDAMDENKTLRSAVFPFLPQSEARFKDSNTLANALDKSGYSPELGQAKVDEAMSAAESGDWGPAQKLAKARQKSSAASDTISRLVNEYVGPSGALPDLTDKKVKALEIITGHILVPYEPKGTSSASPTQPMFRQPLPKLRHKSTGLFAAGAK